MSTLVTIGLTLVAVVAVLAAAGVEGLFALVCGVVLAVFVFAPIRRTVIRSVRAPARRSEHDSNTLKGREYLLEGFTDLSERHRTREALDQRIVELTRALGDASGWRLDDLFNMKEIQGIQDAFAEATGVASIITDPEGRPLTRPSNFCHLCKNVIRKTEKGLADCRHSDAVLGRMSPGGPIVRPCLGVGLLSSGTSICVGERHIANWLVGQVLDEDADEEAMLRYAGEIGADEKEFREALSKVTRMPKDQFTKVAQALHRIAKLLSLQAVQNVWQAHEIAERWRAEEALRESETKYRELVENANSIIIRTDGEGRITFLNEFAEQFFGYSRDEILGKNLLGTLVPSDESSGHNLRALLQGLHEHPERHTYVESENMCRDGRRVWIGWTNRPTFDEFGRLVEVLSVGSDVTERKLAKESAEQAKARLEATNRELELAIDRANQMALAADVANRSKSEFLANMSHEIRTPMTAILGYNDLMLDPSQTPEERAECVQTIRRNGEHLLSIINDILDLSKVEAGKMTLEIAECSPHQIVAEVASLMRGRAVGKGLGFEVRYAGPIPVSINSDATKIRQILINLIGNAIKFTDAGCVTLIVRMAEAVEGSEPRLAFEVIDTGIGIASNQIDGLFKPFVQVDSSTTRRFGGTGLGLAISGRLVAMLGGEITVQSEPGKGSRFAFTIRTGPLDGVEMISSSHEALPARNAARVEQRSGTARGRVLLVEDGPDNQRLIAFMLKKAGAHVEVADNGRIGVDKAMAAMEAGRPFDLVLMDMQMAVLDGYAATRELRERGYTRPIVALTAHAMERDRQKCLQIGCDDFLTKPIDRDRLLSLVASHLRSEEVRWAKAPSPVGS